MIWTIDPATGDPIREFALDDAAATERAVAASQTTYHHWRRTDWPTRLAALGRLADALDLDAGRIAALITLEMGKCPAEARAEVKKSSAAIRRLGELMPAWRAEREAPIDGGYRVRLGALGPLLGIMPWNFPLWQVVRFAVPAILNGNTVLLKHAPNVWGSAELLGHLFNITFPAGVYQNLKLDVAATERLIEDPRIRGVSLTGSRRAGARVGELAGRAIKTCVLELGGSDAYVILDDADLDLAADVCARSRLLNAGQSCVSAKRFIVTRARAADFTERLVERMRNTALAPLARRDLRDQLAEQVRLSIDAGARVALGGDRPAGAGGCYFAPTVLTEVRAGQPAFDDELFGPVAAVVTADDEAHAIELANQSRYGLGGAIFSRDRARAERLATDELECGMAFINEMVQSHVAIPFGGIKDSGVGRELGRDGAFAFTNIKTIFSRS